MGSAGLKSIPRECSAAPPLILEYQSDQPDLAAKFEKQKYCLPSTVARRGSIHCVDLCGRGGLILFLDRG